MDDCVDLKKNKIIIDIRPFSNFQYSIYGLDPKSERDRFCNFLDCHVKNSYYMADTVSLLDLSQKNSDK